MAHHTRLHRQPYISELRFGGAGDKAWVKVDHDDTTIGSDALEHSIGDVARVVAECTCTAVAKDDRCLGNVEHVVHGVHRDMREVHEHAQAVHLAHHLPLNHSACYLEYKCPHRDCTRVYHCAKLGQPVVLTGPNRAVCPWRVASVCQCHVASTQHVHHAQGSQRRVNLVAACVAVSSAVSWL